MNHRLPRDFGCARLFCCRVRFLVNTRTDISNSESSLSTGISIFFLRSLGPVGNRYVGKGAQIKIYILNSNFRMNGQICRWDGFRNHAEKFSGHGNSWAHAPTTTFLFTCQAIKVCLGYIKQLPNKNCFPS